MTFKPRMTAERRAIHVLQPLRWRRWGGVVADVWHVHGQTGGGGHYVSPDPRLVVFLGEPDNTMFLRTDPTKRWTKAARAFYIPAGVPLWSRIEAGGNYSHLDLHLQAGALRRRLQADADITVPRFLKDSAQIATLSRMIAAEIETPKRPEQVVDGLLSALLAEIFDLGPDVPGKNAKGGLPPYVVTRLTGHVAQHLHRRIDVSELAQIAGLSESWFTRATKNTLGMTPQRWLQRQRLDAATTLMAETGHDLAQIAAVTGFSDQAHLTRAFRNLTGETPAAWRRSRIGADRSKHVSLVQANT